MENVRKVRPSVMTCAMWESVSVVLTTATGLLSPTAAPVGVPVRSNVLVAH